MTVLETMLRASNNSVAPVLDTRLWRVKGSPLLHPLAEGPGDGLRLAVKDIFAVAGHRIGAGNPEFLRDAEPEPRNATAVSLLLAAGLQVCGITQTDEFAYSLDGLNEHYGAPPNACRPNACPGGSSSGSVAAVALGEADVGLGSDTAGSIRVPASHQGLFGLRMTHGAVGMEGVLPLAPRFDAIGLATASTEPMRIAAKALVGAHTKSLPSRLLRFRGLEGSCEAGVIRALEGCLHGSHCSMVTDFHPLELETFETWQNAFRIVQGYEAWSEHGQWIGVHRNAVSAAIGARFDMAAAISADEYAVALAQVETARSALLDLLRVGVIALPTVPDAALLLDAPAPALEVRRRATVLLTCLASIAGAPALSIPLLRNSSDFAVGLTLIGRPGDDLALIDLADALSSAYRRPGADSCAMLRST